MRDRESAHSTPGPDRLLASGFAVDGKLNDFPSSAIQSGKSSVICRVSSVPRIIRLGAIEGDTPKGPIHSHSIVAGASNRLKSLEFPPRKFNFTVTLTVKTFCLVPIAGDRWLRANSLRNWRSTLHLSCGKGSSSLVLGRFDHIRKRSKMFTCTLAQAIAAPGHTPSGE